MEGQLPPLVAPGGGELAVHGGLVHPDAHGGDLEGTLEHRIPHEDVPVQLPVVVVRGPAVVAGPRFQGLANLHEEHSPVLPADLGLPFRGLQVGIAVLQLLGGDEIHVPVGPEVQGGEVVPQDGGRVAQGPHDVPHRVLEVLESPVLGGDVLFPVPLVHVDGVEVVHDLVPADGVHVREEAHAHGELISLQGQALPLGQGVDHLPLGPHVGDVEGDGALHAVQVVVQARAPVHEQRGGDPVQVQPEGEVALEVLVDELNGPLELVVGQGHFVAAGDGELAHVIKPVLFELIMDN